MASEHTPLPWRYERASHVNRYIVGSKYGWNGLVAELVVPPTRLLEKAAPLHTDEIDDNARLIVAAVNAYPALDAMRGALEAIVNHPRIDYDNDELERCETKYATGVSDGHRACADLARAALALAAKLAADGGNESPLARAVRETPDLPRCVHGSCLIDGAGERLEPPCGCRAGGQLAADAGEGSGT